jgi:hypothetical protein
MGNIEFKIDLKMTPIMTPNTTPKLQLHPHSLIIDKFCRTSALMTSNLNLPIILGHAVKHGVESGVSFWSGVWSHYWSHF